jgi:hypothetical protein
VNFSEETLMAYVDGELDGSTREQVERAVAADPEVARRVAAHQRLNRELHAGFDPVLEEPVPAHLVSLVRGAHTGSKPAQLLPFRDKPVRQRAWVRWSSLAASFVLGALAWHFASRMNSAAPITANHGEFIASGALEQALNAQLAADQAPAGAVQMGVSFRSRQGSFCRTFRLRDTADAAGLACRESGGWTVQVLVHDAPAAAQGEYRQAASALPDTVLRAVEDSIAGEPLDSADEAAARAGGWLPKR